MVMWCKREDDERVSFENIFDRLPTHGFVICTGKMLGSEENNVLLLKETIQIV